MQYCDKKKKRTGGGNEASACSLVPRSLLLSAASDQKLREVISFPDLWSGSDTGKEAAIRVKITLWQYGNYGSH